MDDCSGYLYCSFPIATLFLGSTPGSSTLRTLSSYSVELSAPFLQTLSPRSYLFLMIILSLFTPSLSFGISKRFSVTSFSQSFWFFLVFNLLCWLWMFHKGPWCPCWICSSLSFSYDIYHWYVPSSLQNIHCRAGSIDCLSVCIGVSKCYEIVLYFHSASTNEQSCLRIYFFLQGGFQRVGP